MKTLIWNLFSEQLWVLLKVMKLHKITARFIWDCLRDIIIQMHPKHLGVSMSVDYSLTNVYLTKINVNYHIKVITFFE